MTNADSLEAKVERIKAMLVGVATSNSYHTPDELEYQRIRKELIANPQTKALLPKFVSACRTFGEFWGFIKHKFGTYRERRDFLAEEFRPLLDALEAGAIGSPADQDVGASLKSFSPGEIGIVWQKALERRGSDPEAALTSARTLLETTIKHILDERGVPYDDQADLPVLYRTVAKELNLAPDQHTEETFKRILGGCTSIVEGLGSIRSKLGDAHGKGKVAAKPSPRHAAFAVNLAGATATFLIETHLARPDTN